MSREEKMEKLQARLRKALTEEVHLAFESMVRELTPEEKKWMDKGCIELTPEEQELLDKARSPEVEATYSKEEIIYHRTWTYWENSVFGFKSLLEKPASVEIGKDLFNNTLIMFDYSRDVCCVQQPKLFTSPYIIIEDIEREIESGFNKQKPRLDKLEELKKYANLHKQGIRKLET